MAIAMTPAQSEARAKSSEKLSPNSDDALVSEPAKLWLASMDDAEGSQGGVEAR